ncbi:MAG: sigma-70 family RNA polymerase sigma factor [Planctomycetes bacterium]|nr:sigma-70 family RNA polymerase sigma factor [Planctomycetota bacterium]
MSHPPDLLDSLTSDDRWLRRMARQLVRDPSLADDLVQETWVAALRQGREAGRGWLATVLRNAAAQWRRSDSARERRELAVAPAEGSGDPAASIVDRLATQRSVLDAVLTLPEAARTVVLLRFYEDLPPREIARRLGEPLASVKSRLHRALERLRAELDARHGGSRSSWLVALAPFAKPAQAGWFVAGGTAMAVATKWAACGAVVSVLAAGGWWIAADDRSNSDSVVVTARAEETVAPASIAQLEGVNSVPSVGATRRTDVSGSGDAAAPTAMVDSHRVSGRVLDANGTPRGGLRVTFTSKSGKESVTPSATSATDGRFELQIPILLGSIAVDDEHLVTLFAPIIDGPPVGESIVVVADAVAMSGLVVDDNGAPIPGATIQCEFKRQVSASISVPLDGSIVRSFEERSDAFGRFERGAVPLLPGARIVAKAVGHASASEPVPREGPIRLQLVLPRIETAPGRILGQVVDRFDSPIEGARIAFMLEEAVSAADGRFVIDAHSVAAEPKGSELELWVAKVGLLPTRTVFRSEDIPGFVTIVLDGVTRTIEGRVLDAAGMPASGIAISIVDGTPFGQWERDPAFVEEVAGDRHDVVVTGADGGFVVRGLLDRSYVLQAFDPSTRLRVHSESIPAGSMDVTIAFPADALVDGVRGRVVGRDGTPLMGVSVSVQVITRHIKVFRSGTQLMAATNPVVTDADGRFTLDQVPRGPLRLGIDGPSVIPTSDVVGTVPAEDAEFTVVVGRRCHLRVEFTGPRMRARWIRVLDAGGQMMLLSEIRGSHTSYSTELALFDGCTSVFVVEEGAMTIRIGYPDESTEDLPLKLVPGEVVVVSG